MAYEIAFKQQSSSDAYSQWGSGSIQGHTDVGDSNANPQAYDAAYRFPSVTINQGVSVSSARLYLYCSGSSGSGTIRVKTSGIKETNTAAFSSNPFGRTKTAASTTDSKSVWSSGTYQSVDVTSAVNEILGQGGWVNGNAMGFIINDNGSDSNSATVDTQLRAILVIFITAEQNLTPTPITVGPPTFPSTTNFGIRVSQPGTDVKTATESQLFFTSRKKELRVNQEVSLADNINQYAHGLSYAPCVLGYYTDSSGHKRVMNGESNLFSQVPNIGSDATNVYPGSDGSGNPNYFYIFIDPLT